MAPPGLIRHNTKRASPRTKKMAQLLYRNVSSCTCRTVKFDDHGLHRAILTSQGAESSWLLQNAVPPSVLDNLPITHVVQHVVVIQYGYIVCVTSSGPPPRRPAAALALAPPFQRVHNLQTPTCNYNQHHRPSNLVVIPTSHSKCVVVNGLKHPQTATSLPTSCEQIFCCHSSLSPSCPAELSLPTARFVT